MLISLFQGEVVFLQALNDDILHAPVNGFYPNLPLDELQVVVELISA